MTKLERDARVLFIGDSITECSRTVVAPPLGGGFVQMVRCFVEARYPELRLQFLNRGIDGETIRDLARRWQRDVLELEPDHLFVMIGVNDVLYRVLDPDRGVGDAEYEEGLRELVLRTRAALGCSITLMEPTPLEEDLGAASHAPMRRMAGIVKRLADELGVGHIATFESFLRMVKAAPERGWMVDVPHPDLPGQARIALEVLDSLGW
jgi:lysophospholipase L1-like esterase